LMSLIEIFEQQYKAAAAEGAIIELRLRVLANKVPELREFAHEKKLLDVETPITRHFAAALTEEEKSTLALCRELRNKILHCDFRAARKKLGELGAETRRGNVMKVDVQALSGAQIAEKMTRVVKNVEGTSEYVADSAPGADDIYGWLWDAGAGGDFIQAVSAFARAAAIVDRLARS
jgi:hypothetical protein